MDYTDVGHIQGLEEREDLVDCVLKVGDKVCQGGLVTSDPVDHEIREDRTLTVYPESA